jgi:hypothetical protein
MKYRNKLTGEIADVVKYFSPEAVQLLADNDCLIMACHFNADTLLIARNGKCTTVSETALNNNFESIDAEYTQRKESGCWSPTDKDCTCPACGGHNG